MIDSMVGEYMVRSPRVAKPEMTVGEALTFLQELRIRHLPVVEGKRLIGLVSERDLITAPATKRVQDVMVRRVYIAHSTTALSEVASEMADNKYGSAVIVDKNNHVVGIFTTTDALRVLAEMDERDPVLNYMIEEEDWVDQELGPNYAQM